MDASLVVRDVTAAAISRADQRFPAGLEGDSRSDRVAVLARASKVEDEVIPLAGRLVPEDDAIFVMMGDDQIEVAVAVQVTGGKASAQVPGAEIRTAVR